MKILRVPWIGHDVTSIYSVDFNPIEPIVATAGGDSNVLIWSADPIFSEEKEEDETVDRQLSVLKGHGNIVTKCRWSPDGKLLASASDDETIRIWRKDDTYQLPSAEIESADVEINSEDGNAAEEDIDVIRYECILILKGHRSDVTDLAWSPDSTLLCSSSVDCHVLIWSLDEKGPIHSLEGHTAWVNSVDWDPRGNYIASVSKDNSVRIWSTSTWECVYTVDNIASDKYGCGLYKSARWAPDGSTICVTHAVYKLVPAAILISRGNWAPQAVFAGHAGIVGVSRYAPALIRHDPTPLQVVAIGCDDGSVSIWRNDIQRPLAVIKGASRNVVSDLTWSRDGRRLLFTSGEGLVAVELSETELGGICLDDDAMMRQLQQPEREQKKKLSMLTPPVGTTFSVMLNAESVPSDASDDDDDVIAIDDLIRRSATSAKSDPIPVTATSTAASPPHESRKRQMELEDARDIAPVTRKRKKQLVSISVPQTVPARTQYSQFPAVVLSLPCSLPLPSVCGMRLITSVQLLSFSQAPVTDATSDDAVGSLLQTTDAAGDLRWSWLGQGRAVIVVSTAHHIVVTTRCGLMSVITTDGRGDAPTIQLPGEPCCVDAIGGPDCDRMVAITRNGMWCVWEMKEELRWVQDGDIHWLADDDITAVNVHFVSYDVMSIRLSYSNRDSPKEMMYSLILHAWIPAELPLQNYSLYSRNSSIPSLSSPLATNSMLSMLATWNHIETELYMNQFIKKDFRDYCRTLTSYATLVNENNDKERLALLIEKMINKDILGQEGKSLFKSIVTPVVKGNPLFVDMLLKVV